MIKKLLPQIAKKSILPLFIIGLTVALYLSYSIKVMAILSERANELIHRGFAVVFILAAAFLLQRISTAAFEWYKVNVAQKTRTRLDDEFIPLLRRATHTLIWVIALIIVLSKLGININALIATLGVSSLAIALAAKDTIANIIAGFLIMIDRPLRIGDKIKLPSGEKVEVLDIGIRRSKFLAEDAAIIIVPNLDLSKSKIVNFTYGEERKK